MSKTAIIIGANSDIAKGIMPMLERDGYELVTWKRGEMRMHCPEWDLFVSFIGSVAPVGLWHSLKHDDIFRGLNDNVSRAFELLHIFWPAHKPNASVCFFAGSNPQMIMPGYSAYNVGKMALLKLVEQLDFETPDAKFFALGPGIVQTKIHKASEGWDNPKLKAAIASGKSTPMESIYDALAWCVAQDKEVVGGRNICVSDLQGDKDALAQRLRGDDWLFKLRRVE